MPGRPDCTICHNPIQSVHGAYRRVTGWAPQRAQGGANAIRLAEYGDWAHGTCIEEAVLRAKRNRDGIHDDQGAWEF